MSPLLLCHAASPPAHFPLASFGSNSSSNNSSSAQNYQEQRGLSLNALQGSAPSAPYLHQLSKLVVAAGVSAGSTSCEIAGGIHTFRMQGEESLAGDFTETSGAAAGIRLTCADAVDRAHSGGISSASVTADGK
jgi:hypothetical protein